MDILSENITLQNLKLAEKQVLVAARALKNKQAQNSLHAFIELMMPDPEDSLNPDKTRYQSCPHHRLMIEMFEQAERGENMRSGLSIPPQHGKSTVTTHYGPAWALGRNPHKHIIVAGYGSDFITKFGSKVRTIFESKQFKQIFSDFKLKRGSKAKNFMETEQGGSILFVGRGEGTTGHPCDFFIIDDPLKDKKEADSAVTREDVWEWFNSVAFTRCHVMTPIFIVHTRWHEDDLLGRICDKEHPHHDPEIAQFWKYINIPAILEDELLAYALGLEPGAALWENRFPLQHLAEARRMNPRTFSALYMGKPVPDEGDFFSSDMIRFYTPDELPSNLRIYASSDHAVTEKQENDATCLIVAGVDQNDNVYILDCWWKRKKTDIVVEAMLVLIDKYHPIFWWAARDHISKSIGPFLKKRMQEERIYATISESPETGDKQQKAQAIQGRMSMGKVFFPKNAPWTQNAVRELLRFPQATHDDFVDALAHLGRGINRMVGAGRLPANNNNGKLPKEGTMGWIKWSAKQQERKARLKLIHGGM